MGRIPKMVGEYFHGKIPSFDRNGWELGVPPWPNDYGNHHTGYTAPLQGAWIECESPKPETRDPPAGGHQSGNHDFLLDIFAKNDLSQNFSGVNNHVARFKVKLQHRWWMHSGTADMIPELQKWHQTSVQKEVPRFFAFSKLAFQLKICWVSGEDTTTVW